MADGGIARCMADYVYSVAIQVNSFRNNMADKTIWWINWWQINEYSLYSRIEMVLSRFLQLKDERLSSKYVQRNVILHYLISNSRSESQDT